MRNTFGHNITVTVAGESHGEMLCVILDGIKAGTPIDEKFIADRLSLRRPYGTISTPRAETDEFSIVSGVFNGRATGSPITILIPNRNTRSDDYDDTRYLPRPSHADYTAQIKYCGYQDFRGGGHFSGRITAGIVAAGAIAEAILLDKGIRIVTHISRLGGVSDRSFGDFSSDSELLTGRKFPVLSGDAEAKMKCIIENARENGDSVGGVLETAVTGVPAGIGEPWFDSIESVLSHILFSIPAVKGVEFGDGFAIADMNGSTANDPIINENGNIITSSNHNGGINGGISNGMPIIFRCAVKPTPSISKPQQTVDIRTGENAVLSIKGRHDPCIVHRAAAVVNACTALAVIDLLSISNIPKGNFCS